MRPRPVSLLAFAILLMTFRAAAPSAAEASDVLLSAVSAAVSPAAAFPPSVSAKGDAWLRIFTPDTPIRLEPPLTKVGEWVALDHMGRNVLEGVLKSGEKTLDLGSLRSGAYYLFQGFEKTGPPTRHSGPANRLCFLVLPDAALLPEDHFFAVNQPDVARLGENAGSSSDCAFILAAMHRIGLHRLRTGFEPRALQHKETSNGKSGTENLDWQPFLRLVDAAALKKIRFIARIGLSDARRGNRSPSPRFPRLSPAIPSSAASASEATAADGQTDRSPEDPDEDRMRALFRRFGFKLDEFALLSESQEPGAPDAPDGFLQRAEPTYRMLKIYSPYCTVALGGLERFAPGGEFDDSSVALQKLLREGAAFYDVLDHAADGPLETARAGAATLENLARETPASTKARAVSSAGMTAGNDSLVAQWTQAAETVKKLVFFRHRNYRYFAAARLLDDAPGGTGFFWRPAPGAPARPRMVAAAWVQALVRLGDSKPVARLGFAADTHELYGFERRGKTVIVAWAPIRPDDRRLDKTIKAILYWPANAAAEALDLLGHPVSNLRLPRPETGGPEPEKAEESKIVRHEIVLTEEPVYIVISAPADRVGW